MGLLRPATPLSIIFLAAFVLLLLSTLSTPIIKSIPIGTFQGYNFGVFGYCTCRLYALLGREQNKPAFASRSLSRSDQPGPFADTS
ncbi:hypothetical protein KC366_g45 [Hortaea werneckii]|nr:hypothetical protein KC366_g45 [Hortaea werneckii]